MLFHPISATIPHIAYACLGGFVVLFGMFSLFIREKLYIGEACWAFLFGVIIGPYGAGVFDPRSWASGNEQITNTITLEFTRVVLAIGVFAIGVELPKAYVARHWKSLLFLLGPVMAWGWFVSAGLIYALIPGLDFLSSLAVGACLTPTDPILAAAVVGGKYADKHVPAHIRHLLSAECGCNDGAAYPFLFLALYLILDSTPARAVEDWFLLLWLYEIGLSVVFGSILGYAFRHLMKFCQRKDLIDRQSYVAQYVSLAFLTIGVMTIVGSDDLLAAFCCGTAFAWDGFFNRQTEEAVFSSVIDLLFNVASFVYVGAWMPFDSFTNEALTLSVWRLIVTAGLILMLKRLPIMLALYKFIPDVKTFREALFSGHFGPVGIGAVYISTFATGYLPKPNMPPANQQEFLAATIQPIVAFIVLCSVTIHGLSIPFFSLGRRVHSVSSRTWSRHASGPDWATYTRHINRGEDVVINKDHGMNAMEKGQGGLKDDDKSIMESRRASTVIVPIDGQGDGSSKIEEVATLSDVETAQEQVPPDGTERSMVWREGSDRVVERREGPGQEVEVEVIHDVHNREGGHHIPTQGLHPARSSLHHTRHSPKESPKSVEPLTGHVEDTPVAPEPESLPKVSFADQAPTGEAIAGPSHSTEGEPDDEEGWASEDSGEDTISSASAVARSPSERKKRGSRSSKGKGVVKQSNVGLSKSRRRSSISERGYCSPPHARQPSVEVSQTPSPVESVQAQIQAVSDVPPQPEEGGRRGRSARPERKSSSLSPRPSIHHRRLESLIQSTQPSREASPARSIRFADEQKSGTNTPRTITTLQNEPNWLLSNQVDDSPVGEEEELMRRVTFDLAKA